MNSRIEESVSEQVGGLLPVVVLAGGLATRLRPLTETIPKCLVEVNGIPFIDIQLRQLAEQGVTQVIILVGYLGEMVKEHVGDGSRYGLQVSFIPDGPKLLGTGGALRAALAALPENFFVLYGDSYLRCSYRAIQERFIKSGHPVLMTVFKNNRQWDTSNVVYIDGAVKAYSKIHLSPEMAYIDYGLMIFKRDVIASIPVDRIYDLALILEEQVNRGNVAGYEVAERFFEIGSHEGLRDLGAFIANQSGDNGGIV